MAWALSYASLQSLQGERKEKMRSETQGNEDLKQDQRQDRP